MEKLNIVGLTDEELFATSAIIATVGVLANLQGQKETEQIAQKLLIKFNEVR